MMVRAGWLAGLIGFAALSCMTGCTDAKDMQIQKLQRENEDLARAKAECEDKLATAMRDLEDARNRGLELQNIVNDLRNQLAAAKSGQQPIVQNPSLPPGWVGNENVAWKDIGEDILFDSGKADLKASGKGTLQKVVADVRSNFGDREVWIVGHTDSDPISKSKWKDNLELSAHRAMTVTRELYKLGLDPQKLIAAGAGEHHPKDSNGSKAGKAQNRRVQVLAVKVPALRAPSTEGAGTGDSGRAPSLDEPFLVVDLSRRED